MCITYKNCVHICTYKYILMLVQWGYDKVDEQMRRREKKCYLVPLIFNYLMKTLKTLTWFSIFVSLGKI